MDRWTGVSASSGPGLKSEKVRRTGLKCVLRLLSRDGLGHGIETSARHCPRVPEALYKRTDATNI